MTHATITPLGTVSPYPKGEMNCPGYLVEYKGYRLLIDCGNGVSRLMTMPDMLNNLYVVVSHYHKDHFGDLGALQYASFVYHNLGILTQPVKIFIPDNDFANNKLAIVSNTESFTEYHYISDGFSFMIDDLEVSFANNLSHTIEAFMVKVQCRDFKIAYTADMGNTNLSHVAEFCNDSDLLICESSLLLSHNGNRARHLTAYDAGLLAKQANVKRLMLTHFWPEEDKNRYVDEAKKVFENTFAAEELVKIPL